MGVCFCCVLASGGFLEGKSLTVSKVTAPAVAGMGLGWGGVGETGSSSGMSNRAERNLASSLAAVCEALTDGFFSLCKIRLDKKVAK